MIIRILYLGISNSLALAAWNFLLIPMVVLTDLVKTPVIPIYPHRSAKKIIQKRINLVGVWSHQRKLLYARTVTWNSNNKYTINHNC